MPAAKKAAVKKAASAAARSAAKSPAGKAGPAGKRSAGRSDAGSASAKRQGAEPGDGAGAVDRRTKPAAPRAPLYEQEFLDAQRRLLLEERATYLRQAETLQAEADSLAELREPGDVQFDEESGEGDTLAVERERDLALSARARQEIEEIDRALTKIDAGTYGICEVSGEPIPKARLEAIPQARERVEYKVGGFGRR